MLGVTTLPATAEVVFKAKKDNTQLFKCKKNPKHGISLPCKIRKCLEQPVLSSQFKTHKNTVWLEQGVFCPLKTASVFLLSRLQCTATREFNETEKTTDIFLIASSVRKPNGIPRMQFLQLFSQVTLFIIRAILSVTRTDSDYTVINFSNLPGSSEVTTRSDNIII